MRSVFQRSLADWPVVLGAALLLLSAATVLAAGALYADSVALGSLHRAVLAAPAAERNIVVSTSAAPGELDAVDAAITGEVARAVAPLRVDVSRVVRTGWLTQRNAASGGQPLAGLASYEDIDGHAALAAGRWPEPGRDPIEGAVSVSAAKAAALEPGDRIEMADSRDPDVRVELVVTGIWHPAAGDPYWLGVRGDEAAAAPTAVVVALLDLVGRSASRQLDAEWRAVPAVESLAIEHVDAVRAGALSLQQRLKAVVPGAREVGVRTGLPQILEGVGRSVLVAKAGILVLVVQFAVLAAYAVLLVAGILLERRRSETALLRARGGGTRHVAGMALGEALLLAVPVALAAPWLALAVVRALGSFGPLQDARLTESVGLGNGSLAMSGIAAAGCVAGLTLPALLSEANLAGVRGAVSRQATRTLGQRLGLDLAIVAVALIGLWQLRLYGAPLTRNARGILGIDPLLVAAPAIGLVAGAILTIRLLPRLAEFAERGAARRRALVGALGARQLARRPLRYTRSALLLMLAVALGTFSGVYTASWQRSQADQAAHLAASDVRVVMSDYMQLPDWAVGPAFRAIDGVTGATPVVRHSLELGRAVRNGELVAFDPPAAQRIVALAPEAENPELRAALAQLTAGRPELPSVEIAGSPERLGVVIDARLRDVPDAGFARLPEDWRGIGIRAIVQDGDGSLRRIEGGEARFRTTGERVVIPLTFPVEAGDVVTAAPIRLLGLELVLRAPDGAVVEGTIDVRGVDASNARSGEAWTPVSLSPAADAWRWERMNFHGRTPYRPPPDRPTRVQLGTTHASPPLFGGGAGETMRLFGAGVIDELPAVAGERFLELTGARVGETVAATVFGGPLRLRIVGMAGVLRPLDPGTPFVVVDRPSLEASAFAATGEPTLPREWWLTVSDGRSAKVVETLRAPRYSTAEVIGRNELTRALTNDPVALGVVGALALGAVAALVFAAIGFVVSAAVSMSERIPEFAILRALGLSRRQLGTWLALENGFLLAFAVVTGCAVGLLLAWLVLPFATFTQDGRPPVPAAALVVPWPTLLSFYALAAALLVPTVLVVRRQLPAVRISDVLRGRDE